MMVHVKIFNSNFYFMLVLQNLNSQLQRASTLNPHDEASMVCKEMRKISFSLI